MTRESVEPVQSSFNVYCGRHFSSPYLLSLKKYPSAWNDTSVLAGVVGGRRLFPVLWVKSVWTVSFFLSFCFFVWSDYTVRVPFVVPLLLFSHSRLQLCVHAKKKKKSLWPPTVENTLCTALSVRDLLGVAINLPLNPFFNFTAISVGSRIKSP